MRYTHLKNSDVDVSQLAVGTWAIGGDSFGENDDAASMSAIRTMLDHGVNLIDTAPCYGNGTSEKVVGNALRGVDRESYLLSTKVGLITSAAGYDRDSSFKNIMREVESSLRNLRTDYIDFYFVHWPDAKTPFSETMCALQLLKEQGKIRHIGVSNFTTEMIEDVLRVNIASKLYSYQTVLRYMMKKKIRGSFLNFSSSTALAYNGSAEQGYPFSKACIKLATQNMANQVS